MSTTDSTFFCTNCQGWVNHPHTCYRILGVVNPLPIGCICPPGANKDCERLDCPRKAIGQAGAVKTGIVG